MSAITGMAGVNRVIDQVAVKACGKPVKCGIFLQFQRLPLAFGGLGGNNR